MEGQVRIMKKKGAKGTHFLKSTDGRMSQKAKETNTRGGHSLPKEHRRRDNSG
jgi:hypothetical protein